MRFYVPPFRVLKCLEFKQYLQKYEVFKKVRIKKFSQISGGTYCLKVYKCNVTWHQMLLYDLSWIDLSLVSTPYVNLRP